MKIVYKILIMKLINTKKKKQFIKYGKQALQFMNMV